MNSLEGLPPPLPLAKPASYSGWNNGGGGWGDDDDWNFDDIERNRQNRSNTVATAKQNDQWAVKDKKVDYNTLNLNKLSDWELD
jgi:hypothetical protein